MLLRCSVLVLEYQKISGTIPRELTSLQYLTEIRMAGCKITGPLPSYLGSFPVLKYLDINGNNIGGNLPTTIDQLADTLE